MRLLDLTVIGLVVVGAVAAFLRARDVLDYHWDATVIGTFLVRTDPLTGHVAPNLLLVGLLTTLRLAVWSLLSGLLIGATVAAMRLARRPALRWLARIYVELVRNTPPIVFIFVFSFFVSSQVMPLLGIGAALRSSPAWVRGVVGALLAEPERIDDFLSGLACLSMFAGAYLSEILRAGLQSVHAGQIEAARALGLPGWAAFRRIVLPQALRNVLPALGGQMIVSIKDSSLVSLVSIQELTFMSSEVSSTSGRFFEVWLFTALVYFVICFSVSLLIGRVERRWRVWAR